MIDDRLNNALRDMGYLRVESNIQGIYFFYLNQGDTLNIVSVIHLINGNELSLEQYEHILEQMKLNYLKTHPNGVRHLSLIFTRFPDRVKHLCSSQQGDSHWIIDLNMYRLMIYETQSKVFEGLDRKLEQILEEEIQEQQIQGQYRTGNQEQGYQEQGYQGQEQQGQDRSDQSFDRRESVSGHNASRLLQFTLFNTTIIVVNTIIFLLYSYTQILGSKEEVYFKGALSWYFIKESKEYYRILTSMFMHADWNHLINNMVVLLFVGVYLERVAGRLKYLLIYFGTGIVAGITSISYNMWQYQAEVNLRPVFSVGASGAIFGVVGAMLYIILVNRGQIQGISRRQMIMFAGVSLFGGVGNVQIDVAAHIGGFIAGILLAILLYRRPQKKIPVSEG